MWGESGKTQKKGMGGLWGKSTLTTWARYCRLAST